MIKKSFKRSFVTSLVSIVLSFTTLISTTFSWFTDMASSTNNKIVAGNLQIDLELLVDNNGTKEWKSIKESSEPIFNYTNWEPGYSAVQVLKVENEGTLTLAWQAAFVAQSEMGILADAIDVYVLQSETELSFPASRALDGYERVATLREFLSNSANYLSGMLVAESCDYFGIGLVMPSTAGNEYKKQTLPPFDIQILATQYTMETDSFGNTYDSEAVFPRTQINFVATQPITDKVENGALVEPVSVGSEENFFTAQVPAGVTLADNAETLDLKINTVKNSEANITLGEAEAVLAVDVHVEGVSENNQIPMQILLKKLLKAGLNDGNVTLYHVENGVTVEMTRVMDFAELDEHNEYFYDTLTGDVTLSLASFSEVAVVASEVNHWDGTSATAFAGGDGSVNNPYLISNASQLAYFRDIVDGEVEWNGDSSFSGQYIKLAANIFLNHEGEFSNLFDPIGWGYSYNKHNRDSAPGKVFKGTFDGDSYAIHGLWQNGWDLEAETGTDYTYTNCGGGLFASIENATIKNLVMIDAIVTYECVEIGIVAGLAQGNCTFQNVCVYDSKIANYQRATGGIVGEISPSVDSEGKAIASNFLFKNIVLDTSLVVGSLWGDFDTPVGGVIGARWDDENVSTVTMDTVNVACELDVYNDVTSTYQWYAYRRAGMLIGNTDTPPADGKNSKVATAYFLTCNNVKVYYTNWAKYNYCQFSNHNSSWPWVRVQAGENCQAYSNPRYGVPNDINGNKVTGYNHTHQEGDQCNVQIYFDQLYGGGQGVYGQPEHDGVNTDVKYLITFMHDDHIAGIQFITENDNEHTVVFPDTTKLPHLPQNKNYEWLDRNGAVVSTSNTTIPAGNQRDIFYYLTESDKYYVHFVDKDGFYVAQIEFNPKDGALKGEAPAVPEVPGYNGIWEDYSATTLKGKSHDVIINAVYSKSADAAVLTDADDLFELLGKGYHLAMSQDLDGGFGSSNKDVFCTVVNTPDSGKDYTARVDLNSFTLHYEGGAGGNKDWTLFYIRGERVENGKTIPASKLTVGDGLAGFGFLNFDFTKLNGNAKPCIFHLDKGATLVLERGVVITLSYPTNNGNTFHPFSGVSDYTDQTKYPGLQIEKSAGLYKITVTARTVLVGDGSDARN